MNGDIGIGKLIGKGDQRGRDAIHIAIAPVIAAHGMRPGLHVGLNERGQADTNHEPHIGIVDPFLDKNVPPLGEFYLFLYPGTITSLRHEWIHPAFTTEKEAEKILDAIGNRAESERWLRDYASRVNSQAESEEDGYQNLLQDLRSGESITYQGTDMHGREDLENEAELKKHAEIVLGIEVNFDKFENFSCAC